MSEAEQPSRPRHRVPGTPGIVIVEPLRLTPGGEPVGIALRFPGRETKTETETTDMPKVRVAEVERFPVYEVSPRGEYEVELTDEEFARVLAGEAEYRAVQAMLFAKYDAADRAKMAARPDR